jgi:DNA primase
MMTFGPQAFATKAEAAKGMMPFLIDAAIERHGRTMEGRIKVLEDVAESLAAYDDPVARSVYVKYLAEQVDINEAAVMEKIRQAAGKPQWRAPAAAATNRGLAASRPLSVSEHQRIERQLVAMMLQFPEILPAIRKQNIVRLIEDPILRAIGRDALGEISNPNEMKATSQHLATDDIDRVKARLSIQEESWEMKGCLNLIRQFKTSKRAASPNDLDEKIRKAEKEDDFERLSELLRERHLRAVAHDKEKAVHQNKLG